MDMQHDEHHDPGGQGVPAVLTRMQVEARELTQTLWAARTPSELMDTVAEAEALKSVLDAVVLGAVRELDVTHGVKPVGWACTQDFVTTMAGGHKGTGPAPGRQRCGWPRRSRHRCWRQWGRRWSTGGSQRPRPRSSSVPLTRSRSTARAGSVGSRRCWPAPGLDATELREVGKRLVSVVDPDGQARREEKEMDREERSAHLDRT